jgi:hypothetical protein
MVDPKFLFILFKRAQVSENDGSDPRLAFKLDRAHFGALRGQPVANLNRQIALCLSLYARWSNPTLIYHQMDRSNAV